MYVRSAALAAAALWLSGCFLLAEEKGDAPAAPVAKCQPGERPLSDGTCAPPCEIDEVIVGDLCERCPVGENPENGRCSKCNDSCAFFDCGELNACRRACMDACEVASTWTSLVRDVVPPEAVDTTCADVEVPLSDGLPGWRENACVAWDEPSSRFVIFGGERVTQWAEPKCDVPGNRCDNRRTCSQQDTWTVRVEPDGASATIEQAQPLTSPSRRNDGTCVSTPDGVLLFGGQETRMNDLSLSYNAVLSEDLWLWRNGDWERLPHELGLGGQHATPAAWDPVERELVVVGGCAPDETLPRRICWGRPLEGPLRCVGEEEIDGGGYPWPFGASIAWDAAGGGRFLIAGGTVLTGVNGDGRGRYCAAGGSNPASAESWELLRGAEGEKPWSFRRVSTTPIPPGESAAMAGGETEILRVGGIDRDPENDVTNDYACSFDGTDWTCDTLTANGGPPLRDQTSLAHGGGRFLLVGGSGSLGLSRRDLWLYTPKPAP